jgi:carbon monoxide dehydrogenase subunit G
VIRIWEPNRRIVLETTPDSALAATSEVRWEAVAGGTRVTMSVDGAPKGRLKLLPRRLVEAAFQRELETALARLKERLEDGR